MPIKKLTIIFIILIIISGVIFILTSGEDESISEGQFEENQEAVEKIKIAACPTCYELAQKLDPEKYEIIETGSTSQSLDFLKDGRAEMIFAGRTLKPGEPELEFLKIADGYSFLSENSKTVYLKDLAEEKVYTDLDSEILAEKLNLKNIEKIDDVYQFLDQGIVITSWENTDYNRAEIVHVLEVDNRRVELSRQPAVYCNVDVSCDDAQEIVDFVQEK